MTFLGLERPQLYTPIQIFDATAANMEAQARDKYINALYNDYQQGVQDMKDFYTNYGNFLSPIQKDMDWYANNVTGVVQDYVNGLYARGIDPLRSAEGRAGISRLIAGMPYGNIAKVRQSAEAAKEYIKNRGILEAAGKWDPDFERFANNGYMLEDWDTTKGGVWNRTSPAELKTLKELTEPWYNNRQAHMLDKEGVESFNMKYDPRYQYMGFTDKDLLDIASGQTPGWNGSVYADYYRDVAKKKLERMRALTGDNTPVTAQDVEKQLQRDVAIANIEWKMAPTRTADQFAVLRQQNANQQSNILLQDKLARARDKDKFDFQLKLQALKNAGKSKYKSLGGGGGNNTDATYHVTEEVHMDGIYKQLKSLGIRIPKLTIKNGKIMRQVDKSGNQIYIDIDDASREELKYAAAHKNELLRATSKKMGSLTKRYGSGYLTNDNAKSDYLNTYGYKIGDAEAKAFMANRKIGDNGAISLSAADLEKMQSLSSIMGGTFNSGKKYPKRNRLIDIFDAANSDKGGTAFEKFEKANKDSYTPVQWVFDSTDDKNTISRPNGKGGTDVFLKGTARIKWGPNAGDIIEVEQWLPIGLVSEEAAKVGNHIKASDFELKGENRSGYLGIDAGYLKNTGSQKRANIALTDFYDDGMQLPLISDPYETLLNPFE